jgi:hypothetical protein
MHRIRPALVAMTGKRRKVVFISSIAWLLLASLPTLAQADAAAAQEHLRTAGQAYRDGDFAGFTESLETAVALNPFSLPTQYNLACGYARTGRDEEALAILENLVAAKVDFAMAEDEDLASLHGNPQFHRLVGELDASLQPVSASEHHFTLDQLGLIPEGIAHDSETDRLFFGSMRTGDVYVINRNKQLSKFATVRHEGKLAAIGMSVDHKANTLWVVGSSSFLVEDFDEDAPARNGVFGFDLDSGDLVNKYVADKSFENFNDVVVGANGALYVSGSALSVIRSSGEKIERIDTSLPIFGSNGIAVRPDGKRIFVSSYPVGIAAVNPETGESQWLATPENVSLYGVDGLYWYEGDLIGVQNGVRPWRLLRMQLNAEQSAVTKVRLIEFANDDVTATTGAIVGDVIHYIGQGPDPSSVPGHFPDAIAQFAGKIVVMTAPLN